MTCGLASPGRSLPARRAGVVSVPRKASQELSSESFLRGGRASSAASFLHGSTSNNTMNCSESALYFHLPGLAPVLGNKNPLGDRWETILTKVVKPSLKFYQISLLLIASPLNKNYSDCFEVQKEYAKWVFTHKGSNWVRVTGPSLLGLVTTCV